jgi:hypothetical protein
MGIQAVAGTGVGLKLRPKLIEVHSLCDALPEAVDASHEGLDMSAKFGVSRGPRCGLLLPGHE